MTQANPASERPSVAAASNGKGAEGALTADEVTVIYPTKDGGGVHALEKVSLTVSPGDFVVALGASGCGKTTFLNLLAGFIQPTEGRVLLGGKPIKGPGADRGVVFQKHALFPWLNVLENTAFGLKLQGVGQRERTATAQENLNLVGLSEFGDHPIYQLSGGMQQRIMMAMALSCNPELIIADEPTTSVDVTVQAQLLELIDNLRSQFGTAVIIITHNLGIVARYVDRVNVMYAGRLVESAPTDILYAEPKHPYTMGLIGSVPRLDLPRKRKLFVIDGLPPHLARLPQGCNFSPRCRYAIDKCLEEKPPLEQVGENQHAACWRSGEMAEIVENLAKERAA